jgi:hypothetical protein
MNMQDRNWHGIMKVLEIQQVRNGKIIWQEKNIRNMLHRDGESFILRATFAGGQVSSVIPSHYYLGLDNRETIRDIDGMDSLISEPGTNGYSRQAVSSAGDFTVVLSEDGHYRAVSVIVAFQATGGSWGPVQNLFVTDKVDNSGSLISTAKFSVPVTVSAGDSVTMRIAMSLRDCPPAQ